MKEQLLLTITERAPMPEGFHDTNTYHVVCDGWDEVNQNIENFWLNFGVLVSMTITPFKE